MKQLTYSRQIFVGVLCLAIGHTLAWVADYNFFINVAWILYGLLFFIHPVWPEQASHHPRIKKYVKISGLVIIFLGLILRSGSGADFFHSRISEALGVDVSEGIIVQSMNDHSGFHGDGTMYVALSFGDDSLEQEITAPGGWKALPLTDNLHTLVYGSRTETGIIGPYIGVTFPRIENGYWFFYDRQGETVDDGEVLNRNAFNYTIAIYDAEKDCLHYCEFDT